MILSQKHFNLVDLFKVNSVYLLAQQFGPAIPQLVQIREIPLLPSFLPQIPQFFLPC